MVQQEGLLFNIFLEELYFSRMLSRLQNSLYLRCQDASMTSDPFSQSFFLSNLMKSPLNQWLEWHSSAFSKLCGSNSISFPFSLLDTHQILELILIPLLPLRKKIGTEKSYHCRSLWNKQMQSCPSWEQKSGVKPSSENWDQILKMLF